MEFCNMARLKEKIESFARFGGTENGGVTRLSLSEEAVAARNEIKSRMTRLGLDFKTDDMANIYCTLAGSDADAPVIMSGSHCDSVRQGGNYDGILGVLCAMEVIETVVTEKIPHRSPIQLVVWTNEEGARFEPAMMSSGVICGKFAKDEMLKSAAKDVPNLTFGQALDESGFKGSEADRINPLNTKALVELHIEQGPVLEKAGCDAGVVEGVAGMVNYEFAFYGQADHAGTFPMTERKDALLAASRAILFLHEKFDAMDEPSLVYTTGKISCRPNIHTVIPGEVKFSLDVRHQNPDTIARCVRIIESMPENWNGCTMDVRRSWARDTVRFDGRLTDTVQSICDKLEYKVRRMYSGAGHDAQYLCEIVPTAMIFVPSEGGHSHCELEHSHIEWCWKGANILLNTILKIDSEQRNSP